MIDLDLEKVPVFYHNYIKQVSAKELNDAMNNDSASVIKYLEGIPEEKSEYRYGPGKWSIKEVVQHLIDAERIFCYRSLSFARKDKTPLPGFDENRYAENSNANKRKWKDLVDEFKSVRNSTQKLFASFDEEQLNASGTSNGKSNYVLAFGFIIIGHSLHHIKILKERYLAGWA
jgi:uncharacterized damage-inducible protein DinB